MIEPRSLPLDSPSDMRGIVANWSVNKGEGGTEGASELPASPFVTDDSAAFSATSSESVRALSVSGKMASSGGNMSASAIEIAGR